MTNAQERKAQERQARRRRIQEAARTVFTERGYAGASIELIARAAQLSVGAIYLYFRSKEDLYVSLIEDTLTVFDVDMAQVRERTEISNRLRETWDVLVRWAEKDPEGPRIMRLLAQPAIRPQLSDEVVAAVSAGINRVQEHIGACIDRRPGMVGVARQPGRSRDAHQPRAQQRTPRRPHRPRASSDRERAHVRGGRFLARRGLTTAGARTRARI